MKVNKIGIAAAGTVAVAGIVAELVTRLVISKKEKKAEADCEAHRNTLLHDMKEYVDAMEDCIDNIDPEADINSWVPIAERIRSCSIDMTRKIEFIPLQPYFNTDVYEAANDIADVINYVSPLYENILDDIYCVQLSGHDEKMPELLYRDKKCAIEKIGIAKKADWYVKE